MRRTRRYWSPDEIVLLKRFYPTEMPITEIAKRLGREKWEIYTQARYQFLWRNDGVPVNKTKWTSKDIRFIETHFHQLNNRQIARKLRKTLTVVRNKCRELGLLHMQLEYWTPEQVEYLRANYRTKGNSELAKEFNVMWPKRKQWTLKHIEKKKGYLGLKRTLEEQFRIRTGRFNPADYKDFNGKHFPQGKRRLWFQNGKWRWMIKVGDHFVHYHRYKWEKLRGPIPRNCKLHFIDGDTTNCRITNLMCCTKSELARRISNKNHADLSDSYIAGILCWRDRDLKKFILNQPELIRTKRAQIIANRAMGKPKC